MERAVLAISPVHSED
jgi:hypothetical protein